MFERFSFQRRIRPFFYPSRRIETVKVCTVRLRAFANLQADLNVASEVLFCFPQLVFCEDGKEVPKRRFLVWQVLFHGVFRILEMFLVFEKVSEVAKEDVAHSAAFRTFSYSGITATLT